MPWLGHIIRFRDKTPHVKYGPFVLVSRLKFIFCGWKNEEFVYYQVIILTYNMGILHINFDMLKLNDRVVIC